jgi:hypothetical protein
MTRHDQVGHDLANRGFTRPVKEAKFRLKRFPAGIFFMLFFIESLIGAGATVSYFVYTTRTTIKEIESSVRSYITPLTIAFADVAEISYRTGRMQRLRSLFRKKFERRIMVEAFFVLKNGKLVVHSSRETAKRLKGNLANDEFSYNLDMILRPAYRKSREVMFTDYNIISKPVPFSGIELSLLKRFVYPTIEVSGWLSSTAVYKKKKPVGTVSFIIGKERIYSFIKKKIERGTRILIASFILAFFVSLLVSLVVLARYRSLQKKALKYGEFSRYTGIPDYGSGPVEGELYDLTMREEQGRIKDAIPVRDKERKRW